MRSWELAVDLDPSRDQPIFLQIAHALADTTLLARAAASARDRG